MKPFRTKKLFIMVCSICLFKGCVPLVGYLT